VRVSVSVLDPHLEGGSTPVVVETEPSAPVNRFALELARALGYQIPSGNVRAPDLYVGDRALPPNASLQEAGLRDGMEVGLGTPTPETAEPEGRNEIRVVSGPGAGTTFRLVPGDYDIGNSPSCRIRLTSGAPRAVARVRVRVDGTAELLLHERVWLDSEVAEGTVPWPVGSQLAIGESLLEFTSEQEARAPLTTAPDGLGLEFNRPPRFLPPTAGGSYRLPTPPIKPDKRPIPLLPMLLVPAISALGAIFVTGNWLFAFIAVLSPLAALYTQFGSRKQTALKYEEKLKEYQNTLARVQADIRAAALEEQHNLRLSHPDPAALLQMAAKPSERLWERRWSDPDFLSVRVGPADQPSSLNVTDPTLDEHRRTIVPMLHQVPVVVPMRQAGVTGVAGPGAEAIAGWLTAQAACLQSPGDLRIMVLAGPNGEQAWSWTRWLQHLQPQGEDTYALVGSSSDSLARRIGELGQIISARAAAGPELARGGANGYPDILVVLEQARRARSLPGVISLLRDGPSVGVYTICIDAEERLLPEECRAVVVTGTGEPGTARVRTGIGAPLNNVRPDSPEPAWYDNLARAMAPLRGVGDNDESALPAAVRLLDLLGLEPPTASAVVAGWSLGGRSTKALLGAGYNGDFVVDMVRDGPHALIAGTTGSGKSELLQTLVASLAVVNRPDEMTFVLVDYKGGSAFAECADLPHTVGLVTDLDTHLVERALVSLGAELRRRETQLAQYAAKDIEDYLDKRARAGNQAPPMPRLLLVIDEFASMARELPDFITGLVNIAQRGRSLGIHLVLATQRPGGAVTPDIRANTNLRIALRTTDTSESRDIIDAPDSGDISPANPGRAFARLGPSALLPFQSGRVGGRRPGARSAQDEEIRIEAQVINWKELGNPPLSRSRSRGAAQQSEAVTDLAVLTAAVAQAAKDAGVAKQPSPWLPPLEDVLLWTPAADPAPADVRPADLPAVAYGLVDLPAQQSRTTQVMDLDRAGHLHIIGSPRSGRSQTLRTLAAALAQAHGVDDLHLYGIDCGNGALNALVHLPHTGVVVGRSQVERLGRLLNRLSAELTARQTLLGTRGTADLTELRATLAPGERPAHIVLMVDRFAVFDREFAAYDNGSYLEILLRLLRDGAGVGLHVILAGDRVLGSGRFSATTEDKLVLRLNDRQDYTTVGIPSKSAPEDPGPGRAMRTGDQCELQIAVLDEDLSGAAQGRVLAELGERLNRREAGVPAAKRPLRLDTLPERISYAEAIALHPAGQPMRPMVGVGGDTLASLGPNLADVPTFLIAGPPRTGRSTALMTAVGSLLAAGTGVIVVAPRRSPLRDLAGHQGVVAVFTDADLTVGDFRKALGSAQQEHAVIVLDDAELLMGSEIDGDLSLLARGGAGNGWGVLAAGNAESLSLSLAGWMGQAKRNRTGMLLSPQNLSDGEVIGVRLSRGMVSGAPQPGRGLMHLGDGALITVQVPTVEPGA